LNFDFNNQKVVQTACGAEFSLALTEDGKIYSWGSPQYGQLGTGSTFEYIGSNNRSIFPPQKPKMINFAPKVKQISAGVNHCHCIDEDGRLYAWGFSGFGRLGLNQTPPIDTLTPAEITGFVERKNPVKHVVAGPSNGMVIDSRDSLQMWGKWKNSGDGGQGTPWLYPK
jgi:alpha-tubulin suppressor-like RCC1 family protein